ncbi:hypothetical protein [Halalkalibacter akibai]|uniref:Transporter n=1 Tax=Halalkalibacter akibai (strain ATCC 43226 / DSM 21942 / CIP 109018 / JCM 9157 / 1139) TaxID=1236973 RepID=W4QRN3_HALA3|nr:hypothetical protein JCM9157_1356 [Halalkalibacter akibai JCM 9157]
MDLTLAHWLYLVGTLIIIVTMLFRQNVVVPALLMSFIIGWAYDGSFLNGIQVIFNASLTAAGELFHIFLIIAIMTALLQSLKSIGADEQMVSPFLKVMKNGHWSFWILVCITYAMSLFFWPAPSVPLIGALLIPVAIKAGLPPIGAAVAISLAGHGMALSSDYVLQVAPALTASTSSIDAGLLADRALVLSIITGIIALSIAYMSIRKKIIKPSQKNVTEWENNGNNNLKISSDELVVKKSKSSTVFAILVPTTFLIIVAYVIVSTFSNLLPSIEDGAGASIIGGTAILLLMAISISRNYRETLKEVSNYLVNGFVYSFKVMGLVIPIAGFFFIGSDSFSAKILGIENADQAPGFLFDLVQASQHAIPDHAFITGFGILILGMISGLDGSGFSALPLIGSLSEAMAHSAGIDPTTLAAIGQMGAIW